MITIVIMAIKTARYSTVQELLVAVNTLQITMDLIELKPRNAMTEILLVPATVAINALVTEFADFPAGRVTGAASQILMEPVQYPVAIIGVSKGRFLNGIMALIARLRRVTVGANSVYLLVRLIGTGRFLQVMAVTAILLLVTVNASQPE